MVPVTQFVGLNKPYTRRVQEDMIYSYDQETDILTIGVAEEKPDFGRQRENVITLLEILEIIV